MLALVRIALKRPYTFVVLALLILIVGPLSAMQFKENRLPTLAELDAIQPPVGTRY